MSVSKKDLQYLINQYGSPDALIDNYVLDKGYAIWGFNDIFRYMYKNISRRRREIFLGDIYIYI